MESHFLSEREIGWFRDYLLTEEKSANTVEKYLRDARAFASFAGGREVTKKLAVAYKQELLDRGYAVRSINSMLAGINSLFVFLGWHDCRVKAIRRQAELFCSEDRELTKAEYLRLLNAARQKKNERLHLLIQTICGTGIRVSELQFITVEAAKAGQTSVRCKGKIRTVFLVKGLKKKLLQYAKEKGIAAGPIFITRNGRPVSRTNIWREMKALCAAAGVSPHKVFPHNLRHLFARTFYGLEKDIAKLADILGHSSINTTRVYIVSSGREHRARLEKMNLIV